MHGFTSIDMLLILSKHSIKSDWVEDEVTKGFEEERKRGQYCAVSRPPRPDGHEDE